jgi:hypothetical protein
MPNPSDWEQIDDGSYNGVKKFIRASDEDHGTVQVRYEGHDIPQILEENARAESPKGKGSDFWHVGHIPASVGLKWLVEDGLDMWNPAHQEGVLRKLEDSDYRHLVPGRRRIIF